MKESTRYSQTLPAEAFKTKEDCDRAFKWVTTKEEERRKTDTDTRYFHTCLPDTVDPRGPKGR